MLVKQKTAQTIFIRVKSGESEFGDSFEITFGLTPQRTIELNEFGFTQIAAGIVLAKLVEYRFYL